MSRKIPKGTLNHGRSGFSMIDPETELYSHKRGRAQHVAISYVWSEWKLEVSDALPDWTLLRSRLLELVGTAASGFMKIMTGQRRNCWLDSKCIDQDSQEDKAYWIPRMDEVYSEARCTVLLLRGIDLGPLVEAEKLIGCHVDHDDHICLLTQSCSSIADWTSIDEPAILQIMLQLSQGTWRRRAWIFQEILLSQEYILSGDNSQLRLSDCGTLASLLYRRNREMTWLQEFANWCRRLHYLRRRYFSYTLSVSNLLQLAHPLEATVQADKFYALCGILRLKGFAYNSSHTADEALQAIVLELTRRGRMSWMYAIRPIHDPLQRKGLRLKQDAIYSYFDHALNQDGSFYAKTRIEPDAIIFGATEVGVTRQIIALSDFLEETAVHVKANGLKFTTEQLHMQCLPRLLQKLAWEIVSPLLQQPCVDQLREAFGLDPGAPPAELIWRLYSLEDPESFRETHSRHAAVDGSVLEFAIQASWALKQQVAAVQNAFALVLWEKAHSRIGTERNATAVGSSYEIALGDPGIPCGARVCSVVGDAGVVFAAEFTGEPSPSVAEWRGSLLPVWDHDVERGSGSKILKHLKSKITGTAPRTRQLKILLITE